MLMHVNSIAEGPVYEIIRARHNLVGAVFGLHKYFTTSKLFCWL